MNLFPETTLDRTKLITLSGKSYWLDELARNVSLQKPVQVNMVLQPQPSVHDLGWNASSIWVQKMSDDKL